MEKETNEETNVILAAAAIAAYLGCSTDDLIVRSIKKVGKEESVWSRTARILEMDSLF